MKREKGKCASIVTERGEWEDHPTSRFCYNTAIDDDILCRRHRHRRREMERVQRNPGLIVYASEPLEGWCDEESKAAMPS